MNRNTVFDLIGSSIAAGLMIAIVSTPGTQGAGAMAVFLGAAVLFAAVAAQSATALWRERNQS